MLETDTDWMARLWKESFSIPKGTPPLDVEEALTILTSIAELAEYTGTTFRAT